MRFYERQHRFYCGIDLHARSMYVCLVDQAGTRLVHQDIAAKPEAFLEIIAPYRDEVVVGVECSSRGTGWRIYVSRKRSRLSLATRCT